MKTIKLGTLYTSNMAMGCMRIADLSVKQVRQLTDTALECGINLFDHADIYGAGQSETLFGQMLQETPGLRDKMVLQSKCGIRGGFYDFSYEHIMSAAEGILMRLHIDTLDTLLFHRPDILAEQEEFCKAVTDLKAQGKVRQFGVSNMNPAQIQLLESWCGETFVTDQMQLSLMHAGLVTSGTNVNVEGSEGTMYDGSLLPYCQRTGKVLQAWSPLQYGMFRGCFIGNDKFPQLNRKLTELAEKYGVSEAAVALAWILRIPGNMQVILGTASPEHLKDAAKASDITLSRQDWYSLYSACGYLLP